MSTPADAPYKLAQRGAERRAAPRFRPVPRRGELGRGWFALAERQAGRLATLTRAEREAPLAAMAARQLARRALLKVRP